MKTIITTVGTSIFTNLIKDGKKDSITKDIRDLYEHLKDKRFSKWDADDIEDGKGGRKGLRSLVKEAIKNLNNDASAEIKSIIKIANGEQVIVHLLATDSVLSVLAAEIIKDWFKDEQTVHFTNSYGRDIIENLQVDNLVDFKVGLTNFVTRFYTILGQNESKDFILNITGGYKALIPFMTILGQVNRIDIRYIFEDTEGVLEIPRLPLKRDDELFEKYFDVFAKLDKDVFLKEHEYYDFVNEAESCLERLNGDFSLNSLGIAFWESYKKQSFNFFCSDDVWKAYEEQRSIQHYIMQTFRFDEQRSKYNVCEDSHKTVCKKFRDTIRIYWFYNNDKIYIYKAFEDYDAHIRYINAVKFSESFKNEVIKNSKSRKIKIENV